MKYRNNIYTLLTGFLLIFSACESERVLPPDIPDGSEVELTFSITNRGPRTRSMDNETEIKIENIEVLVFKEDHYIYRATAEEISGTSSTKEFKVKLITDRANNNRLVLIANAPESIVKAENLGLLKGTKDNVLKSLEFENTGRWPAALDGTTNTRAIPMYGESGLFIIDKDIEETLKNNPIQLFKALARIDLSLSGSASTDFVLTHLYFYRYNTRGCVVPGPKADRAPHPYTGEVRVRNVTVPDNPGLVEDYLEYDMSKKNSPQGSIYVMEIDRANVNDFANASCLIIGGKYKGETSPTFYRLDFEIIWNVNNNGVSETIIEAGPAEIGSNRTFARMLRNHVYEITITGVSKSGAASKEAARGDTSGTKGKMEVKAATWTDMRLNIKF